LAVVSGRVALAGVAAVVVAFAIDHVSPDPYSGGWTWQSAVTCAAEGAVAVGFSLWLIERFQRRHDRAGQLAGALGRAAFGAYVLQAVVLVTLGVTVQGLAIPPEVKFLVVAPIGLGLSYAAGWVLTRIPGLRRVL
jgi:uncharacterized membrane protein YeiB